MAKPQLVFPDGQCYDCHSCALCCPAYEINLTEDERRRIDEQGWEATEELADRRLFVDRRGGTALALSDAGECIFLGKDRLCRIHAKFGEPAKPLGCRAYPFVLVPAGWEIRVSLRFDCPSVAENRGRPLSEHRRWLSRLAAEVLPPGASQLAAPRFRGADHLEWRQLLDVVESLLRVLRWEELSFTRRIIACVTMTQLLQRVALGKLEGAGLGEFLGLSHEAATKDAAGDDLEAQEPAGKIALLFRQLLSLFGRRDLPADVLRTAPAKAVESGGRLREAFRFVQGRGTVPQLQPDFPLAEFDVMELPMGEPQGEAAEALKRYYLGKLSGLAFCGRACYDASFVDGLFALWLTYPVGLWYARLFARGDDQSQLTPKAVQRALRLVDWHYGRSPAFATRTERSRTAILSGEQALRGLVTWYGT